MTRSNDRLDRIEAILASVAESQAQTQAQLDTLSTQQQDSTQQSSLSEERLSRIEAICESNACAIEAWSGRMTESESASRATAESTDQRLETAIADALAMIADMGRQQQETDQRFEVFLQDSRADRQRIDSIIAEQQAMAQRFEVYLQDSRADRQRFDQIMAANATEHRAFTQNVQVLLAEISRLWQRVAG